MSTALETAYDYTRQIWFTGREAKERLLNQTKAELAQLTGPKADAYANFIGLVKCFRADYVSSLRSQATRLARELAQL